MVSVVTVTTATLQPHMFITGAMDSEDGWKIATFGYSLAAPGGLFLVAVRHGICKVHVHVRKKFGIRCVRLFCQGYR